MDRKETVKYFYEVVVTNHLLDIDKVVDGKIVEHGGAVNTFETLFQEGLIKPEDGTDKSGEN